MRMLKIITGLSVVAVAILLALPAKAEETTGEKAATKMDEAKKDIKKGYRGSKRHLRDASGNSSVVKDAKDAAKNMGDEIEYQADKAKRKAN